MKTALEFLREIDTPEMKVLQRTYAILWWISREDPLIGMTSKEICEIIEANGHSKQNISRLNAQLKTDRIVSKGSIKGEWRLRMNARQSLSDKYESLISVPKPLKSTDSVVTRSLFIGTRGYLEKVVIQINASYDFGLYDCCSVMCRRLLETMIIEVYEHKGKSDKIKNKEGHFYMFADLLRVFENDTTINTSRNAKQGLNDFKKIGDLSAHNRRFNARKEDIDRIRDGLRVASEELLHLANLI